MIVKSGLISVRFGFAMQLNIVIFAINKYIIIRKILVYRRFVLKFYYKKGLNTH